MKITIIILSFLATLAIVALLILQHPSFGCRQSKEHKARILASPNYKKGSFQNQVPTPQFTGKTNMLSAMWGMLTDTDSDRIPKDSLPATKTDLTTLPKDTDLLVWFGHSSYLIQLGGKRFLVDPVLTCEFPASLMLKPFKGTDIYHPCDIPEIDYLIITHEHWDHLDYGTLRDLRPKIKNAVCPLGIAQYLEYWGYDKDIITEMDWYDSEILKQVASHRQAVQDEEAVRITCLPSRHFSNRLLSRNQTLWASFMVETGGRRVYIGGDGGYDSRFKQIKEQFGTIDLAFLENGQYNENWKYIHTTPEDLVKVIEDLSAEQVFTVHHDKFALARHSWYEPDNTAHKIAQELGIKLLDKPIGTVVRF